MCLIILKETPKARIPQHIIDNAEVINPDGFAILYLDDGQLIKTMDYTKCEALLDVDRPYVVHYRYATRGKIGSKYCHPYKINTHHHLFSNGTVGELGDKDICDTDIVADYLDFVPEQYWETMLSMTETRFLIVGKNLAVTTYGTWHEKDGIMYSKSNCFSKNIGFNLKSWSSNTTTCATPTSDASWWDEDYDDDELDYSDPAIATYYNRYEPYDNSSPSEDDWEELSLLAVYGTLKSSENNNILLKKAELIRCGKTQHKYPMEGGAYPIAYNNVGSGHQLEIEVYQLTDNKTKESVDNLEGHPHWYKREKVNVILENGERLNVWMYLQPKEHQPQNMTMIKHF